MKKTILLFIMLAAITTSCSKHKGAPKQDADVYKTTFNESLKTYTPQVGSQRFEYTYNINYDDSPLHLDCGLGFMMSWESSPSGYYLHFNNGSGAVLINDKGQAKAFDAGFTIDNNAGNKWSGDAALSYDYVLSPELDKGELAGKGDKYIAVKLWGDEEGEDKFYLGWIKLNVSANGRDIKVIEQGIQTVTGKSIKTGQK